MRTQRRGNLLARLASLEPQAVIVSEEKSPEQVTVYMPHNARDPQPCGVLSENRWTRFILYDANAGDPTPQDP